MKVALLCLCLASTAFAAPVRFGIVYSQQVQCTVCLLPLTKILFFFQSFFHYLPHYPGSRQGPPSQVMMHQVSFYKLSRQRKELLQILAAMFILTLIFLPRCPGSTTNSWCLQCGASKSNISYFIHRYDIDGSFIYPYCIYLQIYPHTFGTAAGGANAGQVSTRTSNYIKQLSIVSLNCRVLSIVGLLYLAALFQSRFHQILHSSATRQAECGSRKCCFGFIICSCQTHCGIS